MTLDWIDMTWQGTLRCAPTHLFGLSFLLVALLAPAQAAVNDVYIAQNGTGNGSGCSSPLDVSYFNQSSHWTSGVPSGTQIGPGTTVHLCGMFTGAAGSSELTTKGDGTSTSP